MHLSIEHLQWIKARAWRRALFYGVLIGLPMGVMTPLVCFWLVVDPSVRFEWWHLCLYADLAILGAGWGIVAIGVAMLFAEKFRTKLYKQALVQFETLELEPPVIKEPSGFLTIRAPLQWFPFTMSTYVAPGPRFPWQCFVDERPVAAFNQGETVTIPLAAGRYSVMVGRKLVPLNPGKPTVESDYTNSVPVNIQAGETVTLDFRLKKLQLALLLLGVVLISWYAWNPNEWFDVYTVFTLDKQLNSTFFPAFLIRFGFGCSCLLPLFCWVITSRWKKRGFMTALTFAKPGSHNELVEPDVKC